MADLMAESSFDSQYDKGKMIKPRILILEVRHPERNDKPPVAWLLVERQEKTITANSGEVANASISLRYEVVGGLNDIASRRRGIGMRGEFTGSFQSYSNSVSLIGGAVFLDPEDLRGLRVGTYLMNEVVAWAKQWPGANVGQISLFCDQAQEDNKLRRNKFYEQFGIVFTWRDADHREGRSNAIAVDKLNTTEAWKNNIKEINSCKYIAVLHSDIAKKALEINNLELNINNMSVTLEEFHRSPIKKAINIYKNKILSLILEKIVIILFISWVLIEIFKFLNG